MDKNPLLEADSFSANQIPLIAWSQRCHYCVYKSRPLLADGSRPNSLILFPCDRPVLFPHHNSVCMSHFSHPSQAPPISYYLI